MNDRLLDLRDGYVDGGLLAALEWGACDTCGSHSYCPICGEYRKDGHDPDCPVDELFAALRQREAVSPTNRTEA